MSNYLAQIAARSVVAEQPMPAPAHPAVETAGDDPFDGVGFATPETTAVNEVAPVTKEVTGKVQPTNEQSPAAASITVKPVYLSKYMERNEVYSKETVYKNTTKPPSSPAVVGSKIEHKASPLLPATINLPVSTAVQDAAADKKKSIIPQQSIDRESFSHQPPVLLQPINHKKEQLPLSPAASKAIAPVFLQGTAPVFLQPAVPVQPQAPLQKEKPQPSLVIGKITVEIVPAQKPVNKIINHVIKSQPSPTSSAPRSKSGFGLGQL